MKLPQLAFLATLNGLGACSVQVSDETTDPSDTGDPVAQSAEAIIAAPATVCTSTTPAANQVLIFTNWYYGGACRVLTVGFYPDAQFLGVPNDSISSVKVGSGVRIRMFQHVVYGGSFVTWTAGQNLFDLGNWNDVFSSARVELPSRSETCNNLQGNEIALFRDPDFKGDCVVLPATDDYPLPVLMGIANDSASSIRNNSAHRVFAAAHGYQTWGGWGVEMEPFSEIASLATKGINDNVSSLLVDGVP